MAINSTCVLAGSPLANFGALQSTIHSDLTLDTVDDTLRRFRRPSRMLTFRLSAFSGSDSPLIGFRRPFTSSWARLRMELLGVIFLGSVLEAFIAIAQLTTHWKDRVPSSGPRSDCQRVVVNTYIHMVVEC